MRIDEFASAEFNEHFEAVGFDEPWDGSQIGAGNDFNADFSTAGIGGGPPPGWLASCAAVVIGATLGGALWYKALAAQSNSGFADHLSAILVTNGLAAEGDGITLMVAKAAGDWGSNSDQAWRLYFWNSSGDTHFLLVVGRQDGTMITIRWPAAGSSIAIGTVYDHKIVYDCEALTYRWEVNGTLVQAGALPVGAVTNIGNKIIGSSSSSSGRNTVYFVDRVIWRDLAGPFSAPDLMRFASFGFDVAIPYDTVYFDGYIARTKAKDGFITRTKAFEVEG